MTELSDAVHEEIKRLCATGDSCAKAKKFPDALTNYWAAWDLLPEPKTQWEAAMWILAAVGDANYLGGDYVAGRDNLSLAMQCPDAIGNPFIHYRLGQCQFEIGNLDQAADELMRAYMGAGPEIFDQDDPKFLRFLATRAKDIDTSRLDKRWWQFWK
jgi:tetratricopeptide (TPR) repeat protein